MIFMDLDHRARARRAERDVERYPQRGRGRPAGLRRFVKEEPSIDVDLEELENGALEYRLDCTRSRQLWTEVFTEVERGALDVSTAVLEPIPGARRPLAAALVRGPAGLVLALSFGYVDDLGRVVYSTETANYADAFDATYLAVPAALHPRRASQRPPCPPADRLSGRVLHRPLRRQVPERPHRTAWCSRCSSTTSSTYVGRAARGRGARQQRVIDLGSTARGSR